MRLQHHDLRSTVQYLPDILDWARRNLPRGQHLSLIAFRSIPVRADVQYRVAGRTVEVGRLQHATSDLVELTLTTENMLQTIVRHDSGFRPSTYLPGTAAPATHKFLVAIRVGTAHSVYGYLGPRTVQAVQVTHHLVRGRYPEFLRNARVGHTLLLLSVIDHDVRAATGALWRALFRRPRAAFRCDLHAVDLAPAAHRDARR